MENQKRIRYVNEYLKEKFGARTLKICIDGYFTCPNRDGTCGTGGCIFCSERGSGEHLSHPSSLTNNLNANLTSITKQVQDYFLTYRAERASQFLVYFQNFTNTYDTIENLKAKYDAALCDNRIIGLCIATRPDCITEEIVQLLHSYQKKYYVCVELGLQTADDTIGNLINRGYSSQVFSKAVKLLNQFQIDIVAHIMIGLPNETFESIQNTVNFINVHHLQGLKIHSTYVIQNTKLAEWYLSHQYTPITLEYYLEMLTYILTHISPHLVIHRISRRRSQKFIISTRMEFA